MEVALGLLRTKEAKAVLIRHYSVFFLSQSWRKFIASSPGALFSLVLLA